MHRWGREGGHCQVHSGGGGIVEGEGGGLQVQSRQYLSREGTLPT